ncbi:Adenine-specific DNA methylase, N12 class [Micrococcales bacterium KH10]|nr:Adenine-specific DNA methylase, N12 class [Micrococcales bacterium KH10]
MVRTLEDEGRAPTPVEQASLARWGSWGACAALFDESKPQWASAREQLRDLVGDEQYDAARRTTINAHYTDPAYARAIWQAVAELGFTGGQVLEPGCGSGVFMGTSPDGATITGIELDPVTAKITSYLYPGHQVLAESFADTMIANDSFDLAVGNVPFGDIILTDRAHNPTREVIHNHFILKSLNLVKPGGIVAVLTSSFTMDARNKNTRALIAERADLLGAVRLPTGAHQRSAGTQALTDVLILRKREAERTPADQSWISTVARVVDGTEVRINNYFDAHPDRVLGTTRVGNGMYGPRTVSVEPPAGADLPALLGEQLRQVTLEAKEHSLVFAPEASASGDIEVKVPQVGRWDGAIHKLDDGTFGTYTGGRIERFTIPNSAARELDSLLQLRDLSVELLSAEAATTGMVGQVEALRARLNTVFDQHVERFGAPSRITVTERVHPTRPDETIVTRRRPAAAKAFASDPFAQTVFALAEYDHRTGDVTKSSLFVGRSIQARQPVQGAETAADALALSLDTTGKVDLDTIATLLDVDEQTARQELGDLVFEDPSTGELVPASQYLSGDVRIKLDAARLAAAQDPDKWTGNVTALEQVQPSPLGPGEIDAKIGATWIPAEVIQQFIQELLDDPSAKVFSPGRGIWEVTARNHGVLATSTWGTNDMPAGKIIAKIAEQKPLIVYTTVGESTVVDPEATAAVQAKADEIRERFSEWLWQDPQRSVTMQNEYNRLFNSIVLRDYAAEAAALSFPGLIHSFIPRAHQRVAVARMIHEPAVGLFHEVGAGKTAEMVMGAMELRRLGLVNKPVVVVPNHMLEQITGDWLRLYPSAKLLATSSEDLTGEGRRRFVARAAVNEWDGIVMTQKAFERIELSAKNKAIYLRSEIASFEQSLTFAKQSNPGSSSVKQLEKAKLRKEEQLKALLDKPTDPGLEFEQTGIDYIIVDEAQAYKNLATHSSIQEAVITGSKRATDMHSKIEWLRATRGDRVVTFATGTPVSNSITETFTMQRFLRPDLLHAAGIDVFDQWAATFGKQTTGVELAPQGGGKYRVKTRLARFQNVGELIRMWAVFADVKTAEDLNLPVPKIAVNSSGERAPENIVVPASPGLIDYMAEITRRVELIESKAVGLEEDNMLKISTDGRKAAMDLHLVGRDTGETSKVDHVVANIAKIWRQTADVEYDDPVTGEPSPILGATQLVFCDFSTPSTTKWNMYDAIRDGLVARGMDRSDIAFIHTANTDAKKDQLFADVRAGRIKVLLGSTSKMGTGTNVQDRVIAMHHIDCPWRPADLIQRDGRGVRQGNMNNEISIYRYITERSFDAYMFQKVEAKAVLIHALLRGTLDMREIEDIGDVALSVGAAKAAASGDPLVLELATTQAAITKLERLERAHHRNQAGLMQTIDIAATNKQAAMNRIPQLSQAISQTIPTKADQFRITVDGSPTRSRTDAQQYLAKAITQTRNAHHHHLHYGTGNEVTRNKFITLGGHDFNLRMYNMLGTTWVQLQLAADPTMRVELEHTEFNAEGHGAITKLENLLTRLPGEVTKLESDIVKYDQTIAQAQDRLGTPFRHEIELRNARDDLARIKQQMMDNLDPDDTDTPTTEPTTKPDRPKLNTRPELTRTRPPRIEIIHVGGPR